jgi:hypothetical protein
MPRTIHGVAAKTAPEYGAVYFLEKACNEIDAHHSHIGGSRISVSASVSSHN